MRGIIINEHVYNCGPPISKSQTIDYGKKNLIIEKF